MVDSGASTNVTVVHYGTAWDDLTLLEQVKQSNLELERLDGIRRHFRYDWEEVARHNPDYGKYVEGERRRLGEDHPLFRTQYLLQPLKGGGGFLDARQLAMLQGTHPRLRQPAPGQTYVAAIDLAGQAELDFPDASGMAVTPRNDSTVITIARLSPPAGLLEPEGIEVVEHVAFTGVQHTQLYQSVVGILRTWKPACVVVDATGIGEPVASFLRQALGRKVEPYKFTRASKSHLGFELLAAANRGGLKIYQADNSEEHRRLWWELRHARSKYHPGQTINFYVDPSEGHDDFLTSLALVVEAAGRHEPRTARGRSDALRERAGVSPARALAKTGEGK